MPAKKKKPTKSNSAKPDYLKITVISLAAIVLIVDLFNWWDPAHPLNMLSTLSSAVIFAILGPVLLLLGLFSIFMFIDAVMKNKWLWAFAILIGPGLVALLYLFLENPKLPKKAYRPLAWLLIVFFLVVWAPIAYANFQNRINPFDPSKLMPTGRQVTAKIITKDLKGYKYDGQTICREMTLDNKYYVELNGGKIIVPQNSKKYLNYNLSVGNDNNLSEVESGSESFDGQPYPSNGLDIPAFTGAPTEVTDSFNTCQISFWSSN